MKHYLCEGIFLKIYSYIGHNALYLNKNYYNFLIKLRQNFFKNPIKLKFKIINFKFPKNNIIINLKNRHYRPKIFVEKKTYSIEINSNINIGYIIPSEIYYHSKYEIIPSKQLKKHIIKEDILYSDKNYINTNFIYKDIITMWSDEIEKVKKYQELWVK